MAVTRVYRENATPQLKECFVAAVKQTYFVFRRNRNRSENVFHTQRKCQLKPADISALVRSRTKNLPGTASLRDANTSSAVRLGNAKCEDTPVGTRLCRTEGSRWPKTPTESYSIPHVRQLSPCHHHPPC